MAGIDIIEIGFNQPELWRFKEKNLDQTGKSRRGSIPPSFGWVPIPPSLGWVPPAMVTMAGPPAMVTMGDDWGMVEGWLGAG